MSSKLTPRLNRKQITARNQSEEIMRSVIRTYAKTANQRLRQLESDNLHETSPAYRQIRSYFNDNRSFMEATKGSIVRGKKTEAGLMKFRTNTKGMTKEELRKELLELDTFLFRAKTSTSAGTKSHYEKIKESIGRQNESGSKSSEMMDFFNKMDMDEFSDFWSYKNMSQMFKIYGSDTVIQLISEGEEKKFDLGRMNELFTDILNEGTEALPIDDIKDFVRRSSKSKANKRAKKWLHNIAGNDKDNPKEEDNPILTVDNNPMEEDNPFIN